jgi:protein AroM
VGSNPTLSASASAVIRRAGAVTIGQSPRPDLLEPLGSRLPLDVEIREAGALDALSSSDLLERPGAYPLTTRLRDGTRVTVDEAFLTPLVQIAVDAVEARGVAVTLLLCAGGFAEVRSRGPLVRPFEAAVAELQALGAWRIGVIVPIAGQALPADGKWRSAGFEPTLLVGDPASIDGPAGIDVLVLDFVGHPSAVVEALRARLAIPVVDLGAAGAAAAAAHFG